LWWGSRVPCPFAATATTYRQALFPGRSETVFVVQPEAVAPAGCAGADRRTADVCNNAT
jgi:hypothetical protein